MKVDISSLECDQLVLAISAMEFLREHVVDGDFTARLHITEALVRRIVVDAMMQSPIALAYLAPSTTTKGGE